VSAIKIGPGLTEISLRGVNAFLVADGSGGLVLFDAGFPTSEEAIQKAVEGLGHELTDVRHILVSHSHGDHTGALASLKARTGAMIYMHRMEANLVAKGRAATHLTAGPGIISRRMHRRLMNIVPPTVAAVETDVLVNDGDILPMAGGIEVIHTPGHTPGHLVFLAKESGAVFLGDAAANVFGLRPMSSHGEHWQADQSIRRLAQREFDVACFGHGTAIRRGASARFRRRWKT
jgi:glyoxylase-like metal-dependent hydrolase (beta-lactamase superfamily II)